MVRRSRISEPLAVLLQSFGVPKNEAEECDICKHYSCWKGLKLTDKWLNSFPKHLHSQMYERWFSVNGFRFLDLPPELREAILVFAIGSTAAPLAQRHHPCNNPMAQVTAPIVKVALVSRQLHREVMPVVYAHTTLFIRTTSQLTGLFRQITTSHKDSFIRHLRFLELDMAPHFLLHLFGIAIMDDLEKYHYIQDLSEANDLFTSICVKENVLRKVRIKIPHICTRRYRTPPLVCQKAYCSAIWSGARGYLRNIPCVEFSGYIDESQKQEWLMQLAKDRKGIIEGTGLLSWKKQIWDEWYVCLLRCNFI